MTFETMIAAARPLVWKTMWDANAYKQWTAPFCEGSRFEGSWETGSKVRFLDPENNGMVAEIAENRPEEFLSIRHLGEVHQGQEDTSSDAVKVWAPAYENYTLADAGADTTLRVEVEILESYESYMLESFPKALQALKALCERR